MGVVENLNSSKVMEQLPTFYCCLVSESMPMCLPRTLLLDVVFTFTAMFFGNVVGPGEPKLSQDFFFSVLAQNQNLSKSVPQLFSKSDGAYLQIQSAPRTPGAGGYRFDIFSKPEQIRKHIWESIQTCPGTWQMVWADVFPADVSSLFEYVWIDHSKCSWGVAGWALRLVFCDSCLAFATWQVTVQDFTMELSFQSISKMPRCWLCLAASGEERAGRWNSKERERQRDRERTFICQNDGCCCCCCCCCCRCCFCKWGPACRN